MVRAKILLVSGSAETGRYLSDMLACGGDAVEALTDGAEAFQRVWNDDYDVIVTELGVPGIDGRDLYMALQNTWPELTRRMVFVSSEITEPMRDFSARTGVPLLRVSSSAAELRNALRTLPLPNLFA
jgi:two-component system NtrC family sensor kinase